MIKPNEGDQVRVNDVYGTAHVCTVIDCLSTQFRATYEVARGDGGWVERSLWALYKDRGVNWELN